MGWQDDLQALLGNVVGSAQSGVQQSVSNFTPAPTPNSPWQSALNAMTSPNNPVHGMMDTLNPNIGVNLGDPLHVPGDIIGSGLRTMGALGNAVQSGIGAGSMGTIAALQGLGIGDAASEQRVIDAYKQGGGKAVFDYLIKNGQFGGMYSSQLLNQVVASFATDPTTYVGLGILPETAKALAAAGDVAKSVQAAAPVVDHSAEIMDLTKQAMEAEQAGKTGEAAAIDAQIKSLIAAMKTSAAVPNIRFGFGGLDPTQIAGNAAATPLGRLGAKAGYQALSGLQGIYDAPGAALDALTGNPLARSVGPQVSSWLHTPGDQLDLSVANHKIFDLSPQSKNAIFREKRYGVLSAWDQSMTRLEQMYPHLKSQYELIRSGQPIEQPIMGAAPAVPLPEHFNDHLAQEMGNPDNVLPGQRPVLFKGSITKPDIPIGDMEKAHLFDAKKDFGYVRAQLNPELDGQNLPWSQQTPLDERKAFADRYDHTHGLTGDLSIKHIIDKWGKYGVDPLTADPVDAAVNIEATRNGELLGLKSHKSNLPELIKGAWGELALATPRFHVTNMLNGMLQNAIMGVNKVFGPREIWAAYGVARKGVFDPTDIKSVAYQMAGAQDAAIYGMSPPQEVFQRGLGQNLTRSRTTTSPGAELISKIPLPGSKVVARGYARVMGSNRQIGQALETNLRMVPWSGTLDQHMMERLPGLDTKIRRYLGDDIADQVSLVDMRTPKNGEPPLLEVTPENVRKKLLDAGANPGKAERIARDVAHEINVGHQLGLKRMKEAQFSYEKTNADQFFSGVMPFMYWQSRAFPRYTEEALRNPILALSYFKEMQAAQSANDDPGMSARAKGFLNFAGTYAGFTALMNPQALWGIAQIYDNGQDFTPEGMTPTGEALNFLFNHGIGTYPWIKAGLNMSGMMGDTFEPDLFSIPQKAIIAAGLQYATARAGLPPPGAPLAAAMGDMRAKVSSFLADVGAPDWLLKPVYQKAGGSQAEASLDKLIENRIVSNNSDPATGKPNITNGQLLAIVNNPNDPEYHRAYQDVANAGLIQQVNNFVSPVRLNLRDAQTDVRQSVQNNIYDLARQQGVRPQDIKPTIADVEFAAGFKLTTGRDWQPSDYTETKLQQDLTNAAPGAKQFILDQHDYSQLQTPAYNEYLSLAYGENPKTKNLTPDAQQQYALEWADRNGKMPEINQVFTLQKVFRATHPEFDVFKQWESGMRTLASQYPGGTLAMYRQEVIRSNPNAGPYFAKVEQKAQQYYPNDPNAQLHYIEQQTISADAWFAITGQAKMRGDNIPVPLGPNQAPQDVTMTNMTPTPVNIPTPQWLAHLGVNWQNE